MLQITECYLVNVPVPVAARFKA